MLKHLRFAWMPGLIALGVFAQFKGGWWLWAGVAMGVFLGLVLDNMAGDDMSEPEYRHTWLLNACLFITLPLLWAAGIVYAWHLSPRDLLGLGAMISSLTGYDVLAAKAATGPMHLLGGALSVGFVFASAGTVIAHELIHRTWSPVSLIVGRWMLALTADASFAIEHVYGHHRNVATRVDPATARRGENGWHFVVRSTVMSYLGAWRLEAARLRRRGYPVWSWRNRVLRGNAMTLLYIAFFYWAAGWIGALVFVAIALYGKAFLEFVNYMEHYGIVRVPGEPVEPRHSWNTNRRISSIFLFNLTRHSNHHAEDDRPFWELRPYPEAPTLPYGYLPMIVLGAIPPLWHRIMTPKVREWDRLYARKSERALIREANLASGMPAFIEEEAAPPASAGPRTTAGAR